MSSVIVHRNYPPEYGEHLTDGKPCWCHPVVITEEDHRDTDEIARSAEVVYQ